MGYWEQNEEGKSFSKARGEKMTWGDAPADIMGDAVREIIKVFQRDRRRPPTEREVRAGLMFSLPLALREARK